jgi:thiol-disulfide isomerase/thioredoxin
MDLWATWCGHCVDELPQLLELQKKYPDDVVPIAVNVDHDVEGAAPSDEIREAVLATLNELKMETTNVICSTPFETMLDRYELFSLPAAIVFDRDGQKLAVFEGDLNYEKQVFPLIAQQLAPASDVPAEAEAASETQ